MQEKYWTDQGVKVYSTNMITGLYRFSKMELHKLEEKLIKENGKIFLQNQFGADTLFVQDPEIFKNIFSKDFHVFTNRRVRV